MSNPNKYRYPILFSTIALVGAGALALVSDKGGVESEAPATTASRVYREYPVPRCLSISSKMSTFDPQTFYFDVNTVDTDVIDGYGVEKVTYKYGDEPDGVFLVKGNGATRQSHTYTEGKTYEVRAYVEIRNAPDVPEVNRNDTIECPPAQIYVPQE
ncbi:MAG: hypothetical protein ABWX94_02360 [Candidatus Saccharimonadales bacterium]